MNEEIKKSIVEELESRIRLEQELLDETRTSGLREIHNNRLIKLQEDYKTLTGDYYKPKGI